MNETSTREVAFKCPKCGHDQVEEVLHTVTQNSSVTHLNKAGGSTFADYGDTCYNTDLAEVESYRCGSCCEELVDEKGHKVDNEGSLFDWLQKRNMLREVWHRAK